MAKSYSLTRSNLEAFLFRGGLIKCKSQAKRVLFPLIMQIGRRISEFCGERRTTQILDITANQIFEILLFTTDLVRLTVLMGQQTQSIECQFSPLKLFSLAGIK